MHYAKLLISCLLLSVGAVHVTPARDLGFFYMVNATGLETPLEVYVDSKKINKKGVESGKKAGGWLEVGTHQIGVKHPDCKEAEVPLELELRKSSILIAYYIEELDKETQELTKQLVVQKAPRLSNKDEWRLGVVNASREMDPLSVSVNDIPVSLAQYAAGPVLGWKGQSVRVKYGDESILNESLDDKGAYLIVLSGSRLSGIRATLVDDVDYQFAFEQWEKKKKEREQKTAATP